MGPILVRNSLKMFCGVSLIIHICRLSSITVTVESMNAQAETTTLDPFETTMRTDFTLATTSPIQQSDPQTQKSLPTILENQCLLDPGGYCSQSDDWCVNGSLLCKPEPDGWLVWLRRVDGSVLFNRTLDEYVTGFGDPGGNYWLGLENLHLITGTGMKYKLKIKMKSNNHSYTEITEYRFFSVGDNISQYRMHVEGYRLRTRFNAFKDHNGCQFSTVDRDNDERSSNCVSDRGGGGWWYSNCVSDGGGGGWWYSNCGLTYPTAEYVVYAGMKYPHYISWYKAFGKSVKYIELDMRS